MSLDNPNYFLKFKTHPFLYKISNSSDVIQLTLHVFIIPNKGGKWILNMTMCYTSTSPLYFLNNIVKW